MEAAVDRQAGNRPRHGVDVTGRIRDAILAVAQVVGDPDGFSFPSGHSAAAMSVAFAYAIAFPALAAPILLVAMRPAYTIPATYWSVSCWRCSPGQPSSPSRRLRIVK